MSKYICTFNEIEKNNINLLGGKGYNLLELSKLDKINVPDGFCITTKAFTKIVNDNTNIVKQLQSLNTLKLDDKELIIAISDKLQNSIEDFELPADLSTELIKTLYLYDINKSFAIRSSATAEDLPTASFAGQHNTYLNISGKNSILKHIKKCWASLFTERAIIYRIQNNFLHDKISLSVIVQEMIEPSVSGIMFTADPKTSNRKVVSIDASYGLGESLVSGLVNCDNFKVRDNKIISKIISDKKIQIKFSSDGGTIEELIDDNNRKLPALSDSVILELSKIGKYIEEHYSHPQDIEWCIKDNKIYILQSRPITTLYPLPKVDSGETRVFLSAGHLQMMTAPLKPLGVYFFRSAISNPPYQVIGGRIYCDLSHDLATLLGRFMTKKIIGIIGDTLLTESISKVCKDKHIIRQLKKGKEKVIQSGNNSGGLSIISHAYKMYKKNDPNIIKNFIVEEQKSIDKMEDNINKLSGSKVFDFIYENHEDRRTKLMQPPNAGVITSVMLSTMWFNKKIKKWIGIENAADTIIQSIPNSVTSDTGLELLDVADVVRKYPEIIEYFKNANNDSFFDDILKLEGGEHVYNSIKNYLDSYGMRCSGDIDITVPRWSEEPTKLIPFIMNNVNNFESNSKKIKFEQGIKESEEKIEYYAKEVEKLFNGKRNAKKIRSIASIIRNYIGYREYPKFSYIKRYYIYKKALLKEAEKLLELNLIKEKEDVYYLNFDEFKEIVNSLTLDYSIIEKRKEEYKHYERLTPQRLITSDGDVIESEYNKEDIPEHSLVGVPVSSGVIEGRARVISSMEEADFEEGDILVTEFTDPSWTPLFVSIKGLITEVGGLMTHGAVISREYGLPAVVSVENATKLIKDGQKIRLNGTKGYVETLD
ncbi:MAG: phosphoenolpyruvate synthase [Clostridiales bacterium]